MSTPSAASDSAESRTLQHDFSTFAIFRKVRVGPYLRGLTLGRFGVVVLICTILSVRSWAPCLVLACPGLAPYRLDDYTFWQLLWIGIQFWGRQVLLALPMLLFVTIADNTTARFGKPMRIGALTVAVLVGATVYGVGFYFTQSSDTQAANARQQIPVLLFIFQQFARAALYGGLAAAVLYLFGSQRRDMQAAQKSVLAKLSLDKEMAEARIQALQAQIQPHFLFNTLANIKLLYEADSAQAKAKALIHDLADYLRTSLPQIRATESTMGREVDVAHAYLNVLKVRMGERLQVNVEVPDEIRELCFPPMMLSTLVENAIKHGLSPRPEGGTLSIRASRNGDSLRVVVVDNGIGFKGRFGPGVGLANTRARLTALYGKAAHLALDGNPDGGVTAVIEIPFAITSTAGHE